MIIHKDIDEQPSNVCDLRILMANFCNKLLVMKTNIMIAQSTEDFSAHWYVK